MFDQVHTELQRAKDNYRASLRSIDSRLRQMVSQDPTALAGARAIQASYGEGFEGADLAAAEQPAAAPAAPPKKNRRGSDKPKATGKKAK